MKLPVCRYETTTAHGGLSGFDKQNNYENSYYTPYGNAATCNAATRNRKRGKQMPPSIVKRSMTCPRDLIKNLARMIPSEVDIVKGIKCTTFLTPCVCEIPVIRRTAGARRDSSMVRRAPRRCRGQALRSPPERQSQKNTLEAA